MNKWMSVLIMLLSISLVTGVEISNTAPQTGIRGVAINFPPTTTNTVQTNVTINNTYYINSTYWNLSGTSLFPQSLGYNVGIGTTSPRAKLESQSINEPLRLSYDGSNKFWTFNVSDLGALTISPGTVQQPLKFAGSKFEVLGDTSTTPTVLQVSNPLTGDKQIQLGGMQIQSYDSTSKVTYNQNYPVDNLWYNGAYIFYASGTEVFRMAAAASTPSLFTSYGAAFPTLAVKGVASQTADLFQAYDSSGNKLTVINANGSVGIGTPAPTQKLNVVGDANITGNLYAGNVLVNPWLYNQTGLGSSGAPLSASPWDNSSTAITLRAGFPTFLNVNNTLYVNGTNGKVGIGTTSPSALLDIKGSGTGHVTIGEYTASNAYGAISLAGSTLDTSGYNFASSPGDTNLFINRPSGKNIYFRENNQDIVTFATGGKVGIGTTSPVTKLQILGTSYTNGFSSIYSSTDDSGVYIYNDATYNRVLSTHVSTGTQKTLLIGTGVAPLAMSSSGYLGINKLAPTVQLDIVSDRTIATGSNLQVTVPSAAHQGFFSVTGGGGDIDNIYFGAFGPSANGVVGSKAGISFEPGYSQKMFLTSTGNVGIGTSTPQQLLNVVGTANITGDLFVANALYVNTTDKTITLNGSLMSKGHLDNNIGSSAVRFNNIYSQSLWASGIRADAYNSADNGISLFSHSGATNWFYDGVGVKVITLTSGLTNISSNLSLDKKISNYNSDTTYGNGIASIVNRTAIINQTIFASETRETILFTAPQAGEYRVSGYALTTFEGASDDATLQVDIQWQDETQIQTLPSPLMPVLNLPTYGEMQQGTAKVHLKSGGQLNLTLTSAGINTGTSRYSAFVTVERLN